MNNFTYELEQFISELSSGLNNTTEINTYNKYLDDAEKMTITVESVEHEKNAIQKENALINEKISLQMKKQLDLEEKLNKFIEEKPQLQWDYLEQDDNQLDPDHMH